MTLTLVRQLAYLKAAMSWSCFSISIALTCRRGQSVRRLLRIPIHELIDFAVVEVLRCRVVVKIRRRIVVIAGGFIVSERCRVGCCCVLRFQPMEKIRFIISLTSRTLERHFGKKLRYFLPSFPFGVSTCCAGKIAPGGAGSVVFNLCLRSIALCAIEAPE